MLIGIFAGAFIAAKGSREFRFRNPGFPAMIKSLTGGLLMGIGSGLAGGWIVSYFTIIRPQKIKQ